MPITQQLLAIHMQLATANRTKLRIQQFLTQTLSLLKQLAGQFLFGSPPSRESERLRKRKRAISFSQSLNCSPLTSPLQPLLWILKFRKFGFKIMPQTIPITATNQKTRPPSVAFLFQANVQCTLVRCDESPRPFSRVPDKLRLLQLYFYIRLAAPYHSFRSVHCSTGLCIYHFWYNTEQEINHKYKYRTIRIREVLTKCQEKVIKASQ